jgi:alkylation response protein AidB-like acyl-CoA dehydrogenase
MDFDLTQEQQMLKESVSRFAQDAYGFETRRKIIESEQGTSPEIWSQFAELGWLSIPFPESQGGMDGTAVDLMVLMEAFGKGLVSEPFVASALLFGGLLSQSNSSDVFSADIEALIAGRLQGSFAYLERQSRFEIFDVKTTATRQDNAFILNGEKTVVFNGQNADKLIVLARTGGNQTDQLGTTLFLVDRETEGVSLTPYQLMDGQKVANITFSNVVVSEQAIVGHLDLAAALVKKVVNNASVAICAEAVGIMEKLYIATVEYSKIRKQFDTPIGSFQALQHRMADMFIEYEQTKSLLFRTVCAIDEQSDDIEQNILALKVMIGRAGKRIGGDAIQIHGGMGVTDELDVGHYVKRLMTINTTFGDADYTQQHFAELVLG